LWYVPLLLAVIFRPSLAQLPPPAMVEWPWARKKDPQSTDGAPMFAGAINPARPQFR
jgi:hypothetical protein